MSGAFPEAQKKFLDNFTGKVRGRYIIAVASTIGILADDDLKAKAMEAAGRDRYSPDEMYPVREMVKMMLVAIEAGIDAERFGQQVMPAFKRGYPDLFRGNDMAVALEKVEGVWEKDTDFEGVKLAEQGVKTARFTRADSPFPCGHTRGIIEGLLKMFNLRGQVEETRCQWRDGAKQCEFVATWK